MLSTEDRLLIYELISLHGHLTDNGQLDDYDQVFSEDIIYDVSEFGLGKPQGITKLKEIALALGDKNPVGHHVTNIILAEGKDVDTVHAKSKGIGIQADGSCGSAVYEDIIKRQNGIWRITYRKVYIRRKPLEK